MKLVPIESKGCENLYRHPINEKIYFKMFRKGRGQLCRSTKTKSVPEAKVIADDYRIQFLGTAAGKIKRGRKFCGELFPLWVERQRVKARPATIDSISASWKHLEPFITTMLPDEVTAEWWESVYVPEKRELTHAKRKFFNDRKWLSMFLIQLKRDGVLKTTPTLIDVDPPKKPGKVYSDQEITDLLDNAGDDLQLQILMAVTMGMRIGEIMSMTCDRIDKDKRTMHLGAEHTKIKEARTFGISKPVFKILKSRLVGLVGPLFASPEAADRTQGRQGNKKAWKTCKLNAGVVGRFHDLRHTFLTKAFKCSTNPALICHYAGLSLDEAERTYLHFTPEDTRIVSTLVSFV